MDFDEILTECGYFIRIGLTYGGFEGIPRNQKRTVYSGKRPTPDGRGNYGDGDPFFDYGELNNGNMLLSLRGKQNINANRFQEIIKQLNTPIINENPQVDRYKSIEVSKHSFAEIIKEMEKLKGVDVLLDDKLIEEIKKIESIMTTELNLIKYGPPGTGKTYSLANEVKKITGIELKADLKINIHNLIRSDDGKQKKIEFITFHQSYSYEEFVEGIRAEVAEGQVTYKIHNGIFKRLCRRAYIYKIKAISGDDPLFTTEALADYEILLMSQFRERYPDLAAKLDKPESLDESESTSENTTLVKVPKFVLCIDEINRANISRVFGELITLIEDTKRQGAEETISVTLPYSGDEFFVPDNLYIRGTMNTADRSLAKLDLALRRRFHFEAYYPDTGLVNNATARNILEQLNSFITRELDREHTIGHSYLMAIKEHATEDTLNKELTEAFTGKIIPLLEEYFLHDPAKVHEAKTAAGISNYVANI